MIRNSKPLIIAFGVFLFLAVIQVISYVSGCRFFLNLTGSEPRGVYLQRAFYGTLHRGDLVFMKCPPGFEKFVYGRKWLPNEWPLLKTVRGVPGDSFCVSKLMFLLEIKGSGRFFPSTGRASHCLSSGVAGLSRRGISCRLPRDLISHLTAATSARHD